jgi:hypothetical protein
MLLLLARSCMLLPSLVSEGYVLPRPYSHSAEKCLRLYIAMVIFTLLYISFDGIKSLSLYDITI